MSADDSTDCGAVEEPRRKWTREESDSHGFNHVDGPLECGYPVATIVSSLECSS